MRIFIINKEIFHRRPPVISTLLILSDLGYDITLICSDINSHWAEELKKRKINIYIINDLNNRSNKIIKYVEYYNFRKKVEKYLKDNYSSDNNDLLWVIGGNTIMSFGTCLKKYHFVLQIQEMHEKNKIYLKTFEKIINDAELVFMNEYNRCAIYRVWFQMKKTPIVLPNKPYFIPNETELESLKQKYSDNLKSFREKKVILYQGTIHLGRDLTNYAKAISKLGDDYQMVLLGKDWNTVHIYREFCPNLVHIDFMPAPDYLVLTSMCFIGLVSYDPLILNNTFCAPNKIFEYGAYSKPMLGNNIPGLQTISHNNAGVLVDENNVDEIAEAIKMIDINYESYCKGSYSLYCGTDNKMTIKNALANTKYKLF